MNKKIFLLLIPFLIFIYWCVSLYVDSISFPDKVVIDIRNTTNQTISDLYLEVKIPDGFILEREYYSEKIYIPNISKKERIIAVVNQNNIAMPGMKLSLSYNGKSYTIVDELHKNTGSTCIVTIKRQKMVEVRDISNYWFQKKERFYYRKHSRLIELVYHTHTIHQAI